MSAAQAGASSAADVAAAANLPRCAWFVWQGFGSDGGYSSGSCEMLPEVSLMSDKANAGFYFSLSYCDFISNKLIYPG